MLDPSRFFTVTGSVHVLPPSLEKLALSGSISLALPAPHASMILPSNNGNMLPQEGLKPMVERGMTAS
jgi:hypothetical protein